MKINEIKSLIKAHPFFALFSENEMDQLASIMTAIDYQPHEEIVHEGNIIDAIYLIASGETEVSKKILTRGTSEAIPISILHQGDAIGLSDNDLFSKHGQRSSTITALTAVTVIKIEIEMLNDFIQKNAHHYPAFQKILNQITLINFIKKSKGLNQISLQTLSSVIDEIKIITFEKGAFIFHERDLSDNAYLIQSGKIEIFNLDRNGEKNTLTTLGEHDIFGEVGLLYHRTRGASSIALEDSSVIVFDQKLFELLIHQNPAVSQDLEALIAERNKK